MILELSAFGAVKRKLSTLCKTGGLRGLLLQLRQLSPGKPAWHSLPHFTKIRRLTQIKKIIDFYASWEKGRRNAKYEMKLLLNMNNYAAWRASCSASSSAYLEDQRACRHTPLIPKCGRWRQKEQLKPHSAPVWVWLRFGVQRPCLNKRTTYKKAVLLYKEIYICQHVLGKQQLQLCSLMILCPGFLPHHIPEVRDVQVPWTQNSETMSPR